jgi:hypothetical protein
MCTNNNAVINNKCGRFRDLILIFRIPTGMRPQKDSPAAMGFWCLRGIRCTDGGLSSPNKFSWDHGHLSYKSRHSRVWFAGVHLTLGSSRCSEWEEGPKCWEIYSGDQKNYKLGQDTTTPHSGSSGRYDLNYERQCID